MSIDEARLCYEYALEHGRYDADASEVEVIATSAEYSYKYAANVLNSVFELGENIISTDPEFSLSYATFILEGPFVLGEITISKSPIHSTYYAINVLDDRFVLGEAAIYSSDEYSELYETEILSRIKYTNKKDTSPVMNDEVDMNRYSTNYAKDAALGLSLIASVILIWVFF